MVLRVVWGRDEVIATFSPTNALTRVDLPTFGLPTTDTKPDLMRSRLQTYLGDPTPLNPLNGDGVTVELEILTF